MNKLTNSTVILLILLSGICQAEIINVPDDHETIQAGINASEDGDTILVQPGEYVENVSFLGHNIVVGSLYLTTQNEEYISETIIDGDARKSVVSFTNEETAEAKLIGFTIHNGDHFPGGGIYVFEADPTLRDLIITNNRSSRDGGGIYLRRSESVVTNCTIFDNRAERYGGGIYISQSIVDVSNCNVMGNSADSNGGGILIYNSTCDIYRVLITDNNSDRCGGLRFNGDGTVRNCTIVNNSQEGASYGLSLYEGNINVTNTIIWSNIIYVSAECDIRYSAVENGADDIEGDLDQMGWGDGNIVEDPQFADPENADYQLTEDSPCIDAGDPDGDADDDGTRADLGALPSDQGMLVMEGTVRDNSNDELIPNALLITSYGDSTSTDSSGFWRFAPARFGVIEVTASASGYLDSTIAEIELAVNDTLEVSFALLHPEINPTIEAFDEELAIDESMETSFVVENNGDGILEWSARVKLRGEVGNEVGTNRRSFPVGNDLEDNFINGVIFTGERYLISGQNAGTPLIYIIDQNGRLQGAIDQPFEDERGLQDLAWDGELIWGGIGDDIYGLDLEGQIIERFELENERGFIRNIAYDTANDWLWICQSRSDITACNRQGEIQNVINLNALRTYGLAYWEDDPDGFTLYLIIRTDNDESSYISKINPETENIQFVTYFDPPLNRPRGAFISSGLDNYSTVIMTINDLSIDNSGDDRLDIWQLHSNIEWMAINPTEGMLIPGDERDFFLSLDAADLLPIAYPAEIVFSHNAAEGLLTIPVDLTVVESNSTPHEKELMPSEFGISAAYPNPFNSKLTVQYSLPLDSEVSLKLYDLSGREIMTEVEGGKRTGFHSIVFDATGMPSGLYLLRLEAVEQSDVRKVLLVK